MARARALVGEDRLVGLSTHTPRQIDRARGVDYIGVGPVNATPTKPGRPAVGPELVRYAAGHAPMPFFAIGGIDLDNVAAVVAAGASRIAVVRALTLAEDPETRRTRAPRRAAVTAGRERVGASVVASAGSALAEPWRRRRPSAGANGRRRRPSRPYAAPKSATQPSGPRSTPIGPGERPWSIRIAALLALMVGVGNLIDVSWAVAITVGRSHAGVGGVVLFSAMMVVCAVGMWKMRYWAVLGFQAHPRARGPDFLAAT